MYWVYYDCIETSTVQPAVHSAVQSAVQSALCSTVYSTVYIVDLVRGRVVDESHERGQGSPTPLANPRVNPLQFQAEGQGTME